jgi:3-phosphoshikimate 1-carboxyvinyltransferase
LAASRPLAAERSPWLRGTLAVPGDAIVSALALIIAAASAVGESRITGYAETPELLAVAGMLQQLGARVVTEQGQLIVSGIGAGGLLEPREPLDCGRSALAAELLMGLCAPYDFGTTIAGELLEISPRHFEPLLTRLAALGVVRTGDRTRLPVGLRGPRVALPQTIDLAGTTPETKAALLLASLNVTGNTTLIERGNGWNHAERLLESFGVRLTITPRDETSRTIEVAGLPDLEGRNVIVPGDPVLASLGAVAASIVPASEIRIERVLLNPRRTTFLSALVAMGASVEAHGLTLIDGEEVADLVVRQAPLNGIALGATHVGAMMEELPLLAIAAAFAEGSTVLHLPDALAFAAHDRIVAITRGLFVNGIRAEATDDTLIIHGTAEPRGGGRVVTDGDTAIAMSFLVLGMAAKDQVTIDDWSGIEERFPGFVEAFENIGASFVRYE